MKIEDLVVMIDSVLKSNLRDETKLEMINLSLMMVKAVFNDDNTN